MRNPFAISSLPHAVVSALAFALALWTPPAAGATPDPAETAGPGATFGGACAGLPVAEVRFEGCEDSRSATPKEQDKLRTLTELVPGIPWDSALVTRAVGRLLETRLFHTVQPGCEVEEAGAVVVFRVVPTRVVRRVKISGNQAFYESDIRKRLFLRRGTVLAPYGPLLAEDLERQVASIQRLYARAGFGRAAVEARLGKREGERVDLLITIDEGPKDRVGEVRVTLHRRQGDDAPSGCPTLSAGALRSATKLTRGDIYTPLAARRARQAVLELVRGKGYIAPRAALSYDGEQQRIDVAVHVDRCFAISFFRRQAADRWGRGFRRIEDDALREALPFGESGAFDQDEAEIGRQELERLYEGRGHLFADVQLDFRDYRVDSRPPGTPSDVAGDVRYYITEDNVTEIRGIEFRGVRAFAPEKVRSWMETEIYDFFGSGGYLQVQQVFWDLANVRDQYQREGYLRFRYADCPKLGRARPIAARLDTRDVRDAGAAEPAEGVDTDQRIQRRVRRVGSTTFVDYVHGDACFTVQREGDEGTIYLHVAVDEGPRSQLGRVTIVNDRPPTARAVSLKEVRDTLALRSNGPFSSAKVNAAVERLVRLYKSRGVHPIDVGVACEARSPAVPPEFCRIETVVADEVSLTLTVTEGPRRTVGQRFVHGAFLTREEIVLRDLPKPGEPYDETRLVEGTKRLRDLGVFESLKLTPVGLDEQPPADEIGLVVEVEESRAKFLDLAVGFETLHRDEDNVPSFLARAISGGLGAADERSFGFGESPLVSLPDLLVVFEASYIHRNFLGLGKELHLPLKYGLSTTAADRLASFKPTYLDSRFLGFDLLFRFTPFVVYDRATQSLDKFEYGAEFDFSKKLTPDLYAGLGYELSRIQIRDPNIADAEFGPFTLQNKLNPRLSWDLTDSPLNPKQGLYLGASFSYINALQDEQFDNFIKYETNIKLYLTIRGTVTFAVFARYGGSYTFGAADLPLDERYRLGGNQGMRGFADDAVRQYDTNGKLRVDRDIDKDGNEIPVPIATGGDTVINGTVEVRFPILSRLDLWGGAFLDWGALAEDPSDLHAKSFRVSVGLGIRWLVGGQIPIRVDYGVILDPRCKRYTETWECVPEEFGNLHFGILYTF